MYFSKNRAYPLTSDGLTTKAYSIEDSKKDLSVVYLQTGVKLAKLYAPAVALGALSITGILASNNILRKRNVALNLTGFCRRQPQHIVNIVQEKAFLCPEQQAIEITPVSMPVVTYIPIEDISESSAEEIAEEELLSEEDISLIALVTMAEAEGSASLLNRAKGSLSYPDRDFLSQHHPIHLLVSMPVVTYIPIEEISESSTEEIVKEELLSEEDISLIALVTMAEAEGECEKDLLSFIT